MLLLAPPTSYRIHAYLDAGRDLGVDAIVASQGEHSLVPAIAGGLRVDLASPDAVLDAVRAAARERPIDGVVATDDATVEVAQRAAAALGLPHNPPGAARTARRKDLARAALRDARVPVPAFRRVDVGAALAPQLRGVAFPCVVKPLALAASRGVIRADDAAALEAACRRSAAIAEAAGAGDAEERRHVLVETFVPGPEVALEGMLRGGRLTVLALFDKPDPLDGPFFEETYYVTPSRLDATRRGRIAARVAEACAAYGLAEGPVHAELRLGGGEEWVLEVAARTIGGDCARLLDFGAGQGLEHLVLRHALGEAVAVEREHPAAGVLMLPTPAAGTLRRVEGILEASRVPGIEDVAVLVREGYELVPLPEGGSYLGFVFARGATPEDVEAALRAAHARLDVVVAPAWRVEVG